MINMLSPERKNELRAARTNLSLLRYIGILLVAVVFVGSASYGIDQHLVDTKEKTEILIESQSTTQIDQSQPIEVEAQELRDNLMGARSILDSEIRYSEVLTTIASHLPDGVIIRNISLDQSTFASPLQLDIYAVNNDAALKTEASFAESPDIFSNFSLQSLSSGSSPSVNHPVSASITISMNRAAL